MSKELKILQQDETLKRLKMLQMIYRTTVIIVRGYEMKKTILCSFKAPYLYRSKRCILAPLGNLTAFTELIKDFEIRYQAKVYHAIKIDRTLNLLYISRYTEEWETERNQLANGTPIVYCINLDDNTKSKFQAIEIIGAYPGITKLA